MDTKHIFVRRKSECHWSHRTHPFVDREFTSNGKYDVSSDNLDAAVKLLENHMPGSLVSEWLALITGRKPSADTINPLCQSVMTGQHSNGSDYTTAGKLLSNLETTKNCSHVYIFGRYDKAMDNIRVTKTRRTEKKKNDPCHQTTEEFADLTK